MMACYYKSTSQALCWCLSLRPLTFYVECSRAVRHFQAWSQLFLMSYSDGSGVYAGQLPSSSHTRPVSPIPAVLLTNVSVTLASHCFHQSAVLWHGTAGLWWLRAEKSNTYLLRRERRRLIVAMMTLLGFPEEHAEETVWCYWVPVSTVWETQETGNYPHFTSRLAGIEYKRIVFFPAWQQANAKQM